MTEKITPFLWFNDNAEEAMNYYLSIFKDGKILSVTRYGDAGPGPKGSVMTAQFELFGQRFTALNGGPNFKFTEAISFVIDCQDQKEVDYYWDALSAGGQTQMCGWLKDKFGLCWQVVPRILPKLFQEKDPVKSQRIMQAMLKMKKIDIAALEEAGK
jgi:predicted 3-demethylubiquinone-9 3-methyltransferase (glyoxalase superfamily)